jgi:hypothetical protein
LRVVSGAVLLAVSTFCFGGIGFGYCPAENRHPNPVADWGGLNYSELSTLGSWVIPANVRRKLFVALRLEVAHHFIEGSAGGRSRRFEPPATFGAAKTSKMLVLDPYQLPAHGRES